MATRPTTGKNAFSATAQHEYSPAAEYADQHHTLPVGDEILGQDTSNESGVFPAAHATLDAVTAEEPPPTYAEVTQAKKKFLQKSTSMFARSLKSALSLKKPNRVVAIPAHDPAPPDDLDASSDAGMLRERERAIYTYIYICMKRKVRDGSLYLFTKRTLQFLVDLSATASLPTPRFRAPGNVGQRSITFG